MSSTSKPVQKPGNTSVAKRAQGLQFKATPVASPAAAPSLETTSPRDQSNGVSQPAQAGSRAGITGIEYLATTFKHSHKTAELEAEVERLKQERGLLQLDPSVIAQSRWTNRHPDSFKSQEFLSLKAEIESAGGNVQPIMVRPFPEGKSGPNGEQYELVFGHRRHEACRQLGLVVAAVVKEVDETSLFVFMERENRERLSLSAWEQGTMYRRAVEERLFSTKHKLATSIGMDPSQLNKALAIAELPEVVVQAFASPTQIQYRFGPALVAALGKNADAVKARALELSGSKRPANEVFKLLVAAAESSAGDVVRTETRQIDLGSGRNVSLRIDKNGRLILESSVGLLAGDRIKEFEETLRAFFK